MKTGGQHFYIYPEQLRKILIKMINTDLSMFVLLRGGLYTPWSHLTPQQPVFGELSRVYVIEHEES